MKIIFCVCDSLQNRTVSISFPFFSYQRKENRSGQVECVPLPPPLFEPFLDSPRIPRHALTLLPSSSPPFFVGQWRRRKKGGGGDFYDFLWEAPAPPPPTNSFLSWRFIRQIYGKSWGCVCCQTKKERFSFCPYLTYDSPCSLSSRPPIILIFLPLFLLFLGNYPQIRGCEGERDPSLFSHFRPKLGCSRRTLSSCFVFPPPSSKSHWPLPIVAPPSLSCLLSMKSTSLSFPFLFSFLCFFIAKRGDGRNGM